MSSKLKYAGGLEWQGRTHKILTGTCTDFTWQGWPLSARPRTHRDKSTYHKIERDTHKTILAPHLPGAQSWEHPGAQYLNTHGHTHRTETCQAHRHTRMCTILLYKGQIDTLEFIEPTLIPTKPTRRVPSTTGPGVGEHKDMGNTETLGNICPCGHLA